MKQNSHDADTLRGSAAGPETLNSLITELGSKDGIARVRARKSLVNIGPTALPALIEAMTSKNKWLRWEATKAIAQIGDPSATQALIAGLHDKLFDVRWLAAEGLLHIGKKAVRPLLQAVIKQPESLWTREGVHHVFHDLPENDIKVIIRPVLRALEDVEPALEVAVAAEAALAQIEIS